MNDEKCRKINHESRAASAAFHYGAGFPGGPLTDKTGDAGPNGAVAVCWSWSEDEEKQDSDIIGA